jgi:hypothetical protein
MLTDFGFCRAIRITSVMELAGKEGDATSSILATTAIDTGARSCS